MREVRRKMCSETVQYDVGAERTKNVDSVRTRYLDPRVAEQYLIFVCSAEYPVAKLEMDKREVCPKIEGSSLGWPVDFQNGGGTYPNTLRWAVAHDHRLLTRMEWKAVVEKHDRPGVEGAKLHEQLIGLRAKAGFGVWTAVARTGEEQDGIDPELLDRDFMHFGSKKNEMDRSYVESHARWWSKFDTFDKSQWADWLKLKSGWQVVYCPKGGKYVSKVGASGFFESGKSGFAESGKSGFAESGESGFAEFKESFQRAAERYQPRGQRRDADSDQLDDRSLLELKESRQDHTDTRTTKTPPYTPPTCPHLEVVRPMSWPVDATWHGAHVVALAHGGRLVTADEWADLRANQVLTRILFNPVFGIPRV